MNNDIRTELNELSLTLLKQDAALAALQITIAELLRLDGEQLEAYVERFTLHREIQLRALAQRLREKYPDMAKQILDEAGAASSVSNSC